MGTFRKFLLGSTIWFDIKEGGYLGAFLEEGMSSPLILQILLYKYLDSPKQLLRNGCEGCHELKTFEGNSKEEILDIVKNNNKQE